MAENNHKTSYPLAVILNVFSTLLPFIAGGFLLYIYSQKTAVPMSESAFGLESKHYVSYATAYPFLTFIGFGSLIVTIIQWLVLRPFLKRMLDKAVMDNEYDENGVSKKKSFANLTRKEREAMDLQKASMMESLLPTTVLKKITKKGSANPVKDLNDLIGLVSVKQKVTEMVARMKFEQETKEESKGRKGSATQQANSMSGRHFCFFGSAGTGKAQPMYSKVLTPEGFVPMEKITVGSKVISGDGEIARVLGTFPQGRKDIYELTFDDGSTCRCSDEHLWVAQTDKDRQKGVYQTVELSEIRNSLITYHGNAPRKNWSIDYVSPIDFEEKSFYIHPYLLGLLIGDGCLQSDSVSISLYDEELRTEIYNFFPNDKYAIKAKSSKSNIHDYSIIYKGKEIITQGRYANFKPLNYHLEKIGLRGKHSDEKFIPTEYLYASREQRLWLLRGLLDTDGTVGKNGAYIEFSTTSVRLKNDIIELVHSLGGYASCKERKGRYKRQGKLINAKDNYRITIQFSSEAPCVFHLSRKTNAYKPKRPQCAIKRYITDVRYVGKEECQCIYIDAPCHTYITDDYVVTHNTTVARIITGFLYQYGYIKENKCIEIDGNFLKAGAESADKTRLIIQKAYGGVLFIDEAYTIIDGSGGYGKEVIATLIKEMEDNRDKLTVIIAGYKNDIRRLLDTNEGFKSRIKEYLEFSDYSTSEMKQIFEAMAHSEGFVVSAEAMENFEVRCEAERRLSSFGNGRTARNILEESVDKHALNYGTGTLVRTVTDANGNEQKITDPAQNRFVLCGCDVSPRPNKAVL